VHTISVLLICNNVKLVWLLGKSIVALPNIYDLPLTFIDAGSVSVAKISLAALSIRYVVLAV
jgi:hypothetical protein